MSTARESARATALTRMGSKRAASSSFVNVLAAVIPSLVPGGERVPPATAAATTSFMRFVAREM
jgi:hypothetical protein